MILTGMSTLLERERESIEKRENLSLERAEVFLRAVRGEELMELLSQEEKVATKEVV